MGSGGARCFDMSYVELMTHWHPARLTAALCAAIVLSGCSAGGAPSGTETPTGSTPAVLGCAAASTELVASVQQYVTAYGSALASPSTSSSTPPPATGSGTAASADGKRLQAAVVAAQRSVAAGKCSLATLRARFDKGLRGVTADGPIAQAVLLKLTASLDGTARTDAQTVDVPVGADLRRVVAGLAAGSTMRLAAGDYRLSDTLVLLDAISIVGAGADTTTIRTTAAGAGIVDLTEGRVEFRNLAIVHSGSSPGDVVIGGPMASLEFTGARVSGGVAKGGGPAGAGAPAPAPPTGSSDGIGVLMASSNGAGDRGTTLEMTDSTVEGNEGGGVILSNGQAASLRGLTATSNGGCGVCFAGTSTGAVRDSHFTDNTVGVAVLDTAEPAVTGDVFTGGEFAIQVAGSATPEIDDAAISGATRGAMIFTDTAAGKVDGSRCTSVPFGIVVGSKALPYLGTNSCPVAMGP
jgi:hypothetical protein